MQVGNTWREAAAMIGFVAAGQDAIDLSLEQYRQLHDFGFCEGLAVNSVKVVQINYPASNSSARWQQDSLA